MAQGNLREYLQGELVWQKKYFYVLRPLLAVRWIQAGLGPVPIEFGRLLDATISEGPLRAEIDRLLERKQSGAELDYGPRIEAISQFVESEIERIGGERYIQPKTTLSTIDLDELFRGPLEEVWGK